LYIIDEDVYGVHGFESPTSRGTGTRRRDAGVENRVDQTFLMVDILVA
jgi:hypothetical protein